MQACPLWLWPQARSCDLQHCVGLVSDETSSFTCSESAELFCLPRPDVGIFREATFSAQVGWADPGEPRLQNKKLLSALGEPRTFNLVDTA